MYDSNDPIFVSVDCPDLLRLGACLDGITKFNDTFPDGLEFEWCQATVELLEQIFSREEVDWFADGRDLPKYCARAYQAPPF